MTLGPDRRRIVLASNQGDIDRLHVWTGEAASGRAVAAVPHDDGIEAYPDVAPDGTIFALRSEAIRQLAPVVLRDGGWVSLAPAAMPASFPARDMVVPQSVTFAAKDGLTVHGQLFLPPGRVSGRRPAIMFFHGGPSRQMLTGFHYMSAYSYMYGLNEYFASKGYVVLSVNYRGGIGYGLEYREAKDFGPGGGSEANDILGAVSYLRGRDDVDARHVGIWGGSYGGLMTALGLARASDAIAVGVDYAGVYDWASMLAVLGAPIEDAKAKAIAIASSPVATIDRWRSPVLVVHADDDRNVPVQQSTQLIQDLEAHGVEHDTILMPNEVHDLTRYASWMQLFDATDRYLARYLKPGGAGGASVRAALDGIWVEKGPLTTFRFEPCGETPCGILLDSPYIKQDAGARDIKNPQPDLRNHALKGLTVLRDLRQTGARYVGRIYIPSRGQSYHVTLQPVDARTIGMTICLAKGDCHTVMLVSYQ